MRTSALPETGAAHAFVDRDFDCDMYGRHNAGIHIPRAHARLRSGSMFGGDGDCRDVSVKPARPRHPASLKISITEFEIKVGLRRRQLYFGADLLRELQPLLSHRKTA
jgi:hypothetical protein